MTNYRTHTVVHEWHELRNMLRNTTNPFFSNDASETHCYHFLGMEYHGKRTGLSWKVDWIWPNCRIKFATGSIAFAMSEAKLGYFTGIGSSYFLMIQINIQIEEISMKSRKKPQFQHRHIYFDLP